MSNEIHVDLEKYIHIKHSLTMQEMFLLYNSLNYLVNKKEYYAQDMKPYKKLQKKIREMIVK